MDYQAKIATNVASIPRSGIRDFFELVQGRDDVISLGVGEPDFVTPWHIREAAIYSLEKGQTTYTSNLGLLSLRKSISKYVESFFHVSYEPATEVLVTGPGQAKVEFRRHVDSRHPLFAKRVLGVESLDHPSEGQLLAFARQYFLKIDQMLGLPRG